MNVQPPVSVSSEIHYPDSDGLPMGETPLHRDNLSYLVEMLRDWYAARSDVYVSGNVSFYYVEGNRNYHLSPDVFVVHGIPKHTTPERRRYMVWEEGKGPDVVIELTSASTREEDVDDKMGLYQNTLRVPEYFLYDPYEEYLDPPLQGYRLEQGRYQRIEPVAGRVPSEMLGLHLEAGGGYLRLYDPARQRWLLLPPEERAARQQAETARQQAEAARQQAEAARQQAEAARQQAEAARQQAEAVAAQEAEARQRVEAEVERLRREIEEMRRQLPP